MPIFVAEAGFFSSLLGKDAEAAKTAEAAPAHDNSQKMALLEANTVSAPIFRDKKAEKASTKKEEEEDEPIVSDQNTNNIMSDNALAPVTGPLGVSDGEATYEDNAYNEISVYVVRQGDVISQIAEMFGVSVNTILWANDMKKGQKLTTGDVLFILPFSGLEHTVAKGQTLKGIAKLYKADIDEIALANGIAEDTKLAVGEKLMIPDAVRAEENDKPVKNLNASIAKDNKYYEKHPIKNLSGYFVNPVPGYRKSQGIHDKNAVDMAIRTGTPIHASASGRVILARMGYNGGYGNLVIIAHPNGTQTLYAHQSKLSTYTGAQVAQGEVIGFVGSTGRSTGPHLHFEVKGARNPGADGSWAN